MALSLAASAHAVIIGVSSGYLVDSQEAFFAVRCGTVVSATDAISHQAELELGFTRDSEAGIKADIMPVMLNYRAEFKKESAWTPYVGLGAGAAQTRLKGWFGRDDDWAPAAQAFAGVGYQTSPSSRLTLGARYMWVGDVSLFGVDVEVGDDVALEVGFHVRF